MSIITVEETIEENTTLERVDLEEVSFDTFLNRISRGYQGGEDLAGKVDLKYLDFLRSYIESVINNSELSDKEICNEVLYVSGMITKHLNSLDGVILDKTIIHYEKKTRFCDGNIDALPKFYESQFKDNEKIPVSIVSRRRIKDESRGKKTLDTSDYEWRTIVNYYSSLD